MNEYLRIPTSAEVAAVILARHLDIHVVRAYTDMEHGRILTAYGFNQSGSPLLEIESTWNPSPNKERLNQRTAYWLCVPKIE